MSYQYATASREQGGGQRQPWKLDPDAFVRLAPGAELAELLTVASDAGWEYVNHSDVGYVQREVIYSTVTAVFRRRPVVYRDGPG